MRLLGRPFSLHGKVARGEHRGTELGFPTVNLNVDAKNGAAPDGVYATRAYIGGQEFQAMTNIGRRPTFGRITNAPSSLSSCIIIRIFMAKMSKLKSSNGCAKKNISIMSRN